MRSRWGSALIKTILFLIIAHIILMFLGYFIRTDIGIFNLSMIWAHWSDNWVEATIGLILTVIVYFIIYAFFTNSAREELDGE